MTRSRPVFLCLLVLLGCVAAGGARADSSPPPSSAIDQYVEQMPTAAGDKATGVGKAEEGKLSKKQDKALARSGSKVASLLKKVATSSDYGAPQTTPTPPQPTIAPTNPKPHKPSAPAKPKPHKPSAKTVAPKPVNVSIADSASAAIHAIGSGSNGRILGLGIAMFLVTAGALIGTALRQRRSF